MKGTNEPLHLLTDADLVQRFVTIAIKQDQAIVDGDRAEFNRLFRQMGLVEGELRSRPGDQRSKLVGLFDHANLQVQMKAAEASLALVPEAARRTLEAIANSRKYPQASDAGMSLNVFDRGIFKPS